MAKSNQPMFSKTDLEKLQHLSDLLHLFHHRNKNQHRRSIWWRHFSIFRRQLNSLVAEVDTLHEAPQTHLQRTRKRIQDPQTQGRISKRVEFWKEILVRRWHNAFSQIVADSRFSVLGLTLIAVLAQTCHIAGVISDFDKTEVAEGKTAIEDLMEVDEKSALASPERKVAIEEDMGEVIDREETADHATYQATTRRDEAAKIHKAAELRERESKTSVPRKRKKKGNAIDDLFSGLD